MKNWVAARKIEEKMGEKVWEDYHTMRVKLIIIRWGRTRGLDFAVDQGAGKALCLFVLTVFPEHSSSEVLPVASADVIVWFGYVMNFGCSILAIVSVIKGFPEHSRSKVYYQSRRQTSNCEALAFFSEACVTW